MADYYSLLSRAVAAQPQSTPQSRQAVYERARAALYNQLRAIQPRVADSVIETEGRALDDAIGRIESEAALKEASAASDEPTAEGTAEAPLEPLNEPQRPAAPPPANAAKDEASRRLLGIAAILIVIVAGVALAAWRFREQPQDLAKLKPDAPAADAGSGKFSDRVAGGEDADKSDAAAPRQPAPAAPGAAAIPVAQKAELWVASAQDPTKVDKVFPGSVIWRLDNVPGAPGEAMRSAIRGDIDAPTAKLKLSLVIAKNTDATLSASHTVKINFSFAPDSEFKAVKAIGLLQMRRADARSGEKINGITVPITDNSFIIGVMKSDKDQRNVTMMRTLAVIDLPMQFADGRNATISLEKGAAGDRVFNDAIDSWNK